MEVQVTTFVDLPCPEILYTSQNSSVNKSFWYEMYITNILVYLHSLSLIVIVVMLWFCITIAMDSKIFSEGIINKKN